MKRQLSIALAATSLFVTVPANALIIDEFNVATPAVISDENSPQGDSGNSGIVGPTAIGGTRKVNVTGVTGAGDGDRARVTVNSQNSGRLAISNDDPVNSTATVIWDGSTVDPFTVDTDGLGGIDLTADGSVEFRFTVPSIDQDVTLALTVWDLNSNYTFNYRFTGPVTQFAIPYTTFTGIDFTEIGAIRMVLSGPRAWDGSVDVFDTWGPPVPIPGTILLIGAGLLGLARRGRRAGT